MPSEFSHLLLFVSYFAASQSKVVVPKPCGTRTTSGTRRSSRWYASTFCLLLDRREFLVQVGLILSFLEPSTLSRSVIPKLCAATDSQVFREAFWKKTI